MTSPETDPGPKEPKADPGDYAADDALLRDVFKKGIGFLRRFGTKTIYDMHGDLEVVQRRTDMYIRDRLGSMAVMEGLQEYDEIIRLQEVDDFLSISGMSDEEFLAAGTEGETLERGVTYVHSLLIDDPKMLRAAGYDGDIQEVKLEYFDSTKDPSMAHEHELQVDIQERPKFPGLRARYVLLFNLAHAATVGGGADSYAFLRRYELRPRPAVPTTTEQVLDRIKFAFKSGEVDIRIHEAQHLVRLFGLYEQQHSSGSGMES